MGEVVIPHWISVIIGMEEWAKRGWGEGNIFIPHYEYLLDLQLVCELLFALGWFVVRLLNLHSLFI